MIRAFKDYLYQSTNTFDFDYLQTNRSWLSNLQHASNLERSLKKLLHCEAKNKKNGFQNDTRCAGIGRCVDNSVWRGLWKQHRHEKAEQCSEK